MQSEWNVSPSTGSVIYVVKEHPYHFHAPHFKSLEKPWCFNSKLHPLKVTLPTFSSSNQFLNIPNYSRQAFQSGPHVPTWLQNTLQHLDGPTSVPNVFFREILPTPGLLHSVPLAFSWDRLSHAPFCWAVPQASWFWLRDRGGVWAVDCCLEQKLKRWATWSWTCLVVAGYPFFCISLLECVALEMGVFWEIEYFVDFVEEEHERIAWAQERFILDLL